MEARTNAKRRAYADTFEEKTLPPHNHGAPAHGAQPNLSALEPRSDGLESSIPAMFSLASLMVSVTYKHHTAIIVNFHVNA